MFDNSTSSDLEDYITQFWTSGNRTAASTLLSVYPEDPAAGSPFDTGDSTAITPQFKRISAIAGDMAFQAPRRLLFKRIAGSQPVFAFC